MKKRGAPPEAIKAQILDATDVRAGWLEDGSAVTLWFKTGKARAIQIHLTPKVLRDAFPVLISAWNGCEVAKARMSRAKPKLSS